MRCVVQVVQHASVTVAGEKIAEIGRGFLVFLGISNADTEELTDKMVKKICSLRIFPDENGKTNLSLSDVGGSLLVVSQFTLYANCKKGNRPSFIEAGSHEIATCIYEHFTKEAKKYVPKVQHGQFGADMKVDLLNDGPFTLMLDSDTLF